MVRTRSEAKRREQFEKDHNVSLNDSYDEEDDDDVVQESVDEELDYEERRSRRSPYREAKQLLDDVKEDERNEQVESLYRR